MAASTNPARPAETDQSGNLGDGMPESVDLRTDIFEVLRDPVGEDVDLEHAVVAVRGVSGLQEVVEHGTRFLRIARPKVGIDRQCHRRARMS